MTRLPVEFVVPRNTIAGIRRCAEFMPRDGNREVRIHVRGEALVARRWINGHFATGHSVLRAHLEDVPDGVVVRGTVAASGLDLVLIMIWFAAAAGLIALGVAYQAAWIVVVALVPLTFGVIFASWLPRAVQDGRDVLRRALIADLSEGC